ncbi:MAG: flagellar basal body-associated FliL family protein [Spirochaetales bacterium]|nr:flagellar basal body-associated FliL family protein [Spirochaetales bacterium]
MADEDRFLDSETDQATEEVEVGRKVGFIPALVLKALKWAAIGIIVVLLVIIVAYLTVQIALQGRVPGQDLPPVSQQIAASTEIYQFYKNLQPLRGQTADNPPYIFTAEIHIAYEKGNNAMTTEINERDSQIHNLILKILGSKNASELNTNDFSLLERDITYSLNQIMRSGKIKAVFIQEMQTFPQ